MKAAYYDTSGEVDVLQVGEVPTPEPGPGEVRIRLRASGVNPSDVKTRKAGPMAFPRVIPHSDGAGDIDAVGAGVAKSRIGERVWIWNAQWGRACGTAAEYVVLPAAQAVPLPEHTPYEIGACLGIPAMTAHRAVYLDGPPKAGETWLVHGAAGAVGHYATQIAHAAGVRVIGTVSSKEKAVHAKWAGCEATIDYRTEDLAARVKALTGGQGVDRVIEVNLSANAAGYPAYVKRDGMVVVYGSDDWAAPSPPLRAYLVHGLRLGFFIVYNLSDGDRAKGVADLTAWLAKGQLKHEIAATYHLEDVAKAHRQIEAGGHIGNVVIEVL